MTQKKSLTIVGAGIGGLTLAIALRRLGIDFEIVDQAPSFEPIGYGIQVTPNAVNVLHKLGLADDIAGIGNVCKRIALRDFRTDKPLLSWQINYALPYYQCLRSDLHEMLYKNFGEESIQYGQVVNARADVKSDLLVAADGVHSVFRQNLYPDHAALYSGYIAYRTVVPYDERFSELKNTTTVWLSEDKHIVIYPVGADNRINMALVSKEKERRSDSWVQAVSNEEIMRTFQSKSGLINDLLSHLVEQNTQSYCWGLFDYQPLPAWYDQDVVLLGDAAHPMLPFMAQGAAMAIEDAWVLAECLHRYDDFEQACQHYQQKRYRRASQIQKLSRDNAKVFHASGILKLGRDTAFKLLQAISPQLMQIKTNALYKYDASA